jgi:hypothetical protein
MAKPSSTRKAAKKKKPSVVPVYTLEVVVLEGSITPEFAKRNPVISRTVQIRGDQTLERLHHAIFDAFDRIQEHVYEFHFGKGLHDPHGKRYLLPGAEPSKRVGDVTRTTIDSLGLKVGKGFGYRFHSGNGWGHWIKVLAIEDQSPVGNYPRMTRRVGSSPPQYARPEDEG